MKLRLHKFQSPDKITLDPECGITKGCFPVCSGSSCSSLVTWQKNGDYILFEIAEEIASTTDNRWIAIGFSGNQQMVFYFFSYKILGAK